MPARLKQLAILTAISAGLLNPAYAETPASFSPYVDLTLNVHWDSRYQDLEPADLSLVSQKSGIQHYHLAFITDAGNCTPAWGGQSSYPATGWGSHLTDKLHADHINFIVSLGGAGGNDLSMACSQSQLVNAYEQIIKTYQPEGLDFDIENGTANVASVMQALQQIQQTHPELKLSFTLPVLPEGLTAEGQALVKAATAAHLNFAVNIMAMDYGPAYSNDMGQYAIQAATNLFTFLKTLYPQQTDAALWQRVQVTPMIGVNDVNTEKFTLRDADTLRQFAAQQQLGNLSMWSITRDTPCPDQQASATCSGDNLQTAPFEFSARFMQRN